MDSYLDDGETDGYIVQYIDTYWNICTCGEAGNCTVEDCCGKTKSVSKSCGSPSRTVPPAEMLIFWELWKVEGSSILNYNTKTKKWEPTEIGDADDYFSGGQGGMGTCGESYTYGELYFIPCKAFNADTGECKDPPPGGWAIWGTGAIPLTSGYGTCKDPRINGGPAGTRSATYYWNCCKGQVSGQLEQYCGAGSNDKYCGVAP